MALAPISRQALMQGDSVNLTPVENELKAIIAMKHTPFDLTIVYDDLHGLWGGSLFTLRGDGTLEQRTTAIGSATAEITQKQVDGHKLVEFARLLVELTAWEQRTPDSQPVPDESRVRLTIRIKGSTSSMWERCNEMSTHNRLIQIKNWMESQLGSEP